MKILIIGNGGREHALAWKIAQNKQVSQIFIAEGNSGCELIPQVSLVKIATIPELIVFAQTNKIDLTIVGSEELLVQGIVDQFQLVGLTIFGPPQKSAQLEGSKVFAKEFMNKYGVKTAKHADFTDYAAALSYLQDIEYPIVIKASGLAAGKGVIIAQNIEEAESALAAMLLEQVFGESGCEVVIEEYLEGVEASILAFTDGKVIMPLVSAKDHKKIGDGETGQNTGGMGVIAPNPYVTAQVQQEFMHDILQPTLAGLQAEAMLFAGVIFFGLMLTNHGVYLLEYNMRLGDPETQAVLPLLQNDLVAVIQAAIEGELDQIKLSWDAAATCCLVLAAEGYPEHYATGLPIFGLTNFNLPDCYVFSAGVTRGATGLISSGGRVLNVVAKGPTLATARQKAYAALAEVGFNGSYFRKDIGELDG